VSCPRNRYPFAKITCMNPLIWTRVLLEYISWVCANPVDLNTKYGSYLMSHYRPDVRDASAAIPVSSPREPEIRLLHQLKQEKRAVVI
jgi:hypothetical protein